MCACIAEMTSRTASEQTKLLNERTCCKCKYRLRWFYSKGAFLVLAWVLLVSVAGYSVMSTLLQTIEHTALSQWIIAPPTVLFGAVSLILSGWLADAKYGNYKVARFGLILQFFGTLSTTFCSLFLDYLEATNEYLAAILLVLTINLFIVGYGCFLVTSLQLGLDQMPDASSPSITSFIAWFFFCVFAGVWISNILYNIQYNCILEIHNLNKNNFIQVWNLHIVLCLSIALMLDFIFTNKCLIIEPKSHQSFKTIYQILKFAAKHKAPLNRSAFTYWEEDIPSRMDLGKSKYGGPFSTEQVEDVKTIIRLFVISLPIWVLTSSLLMHPNIFVIRNIPGVPSCSTNFILYFTYDATWCVIVCTVIYEFVIYPIVRNRIPTILKRIGITSFLATFISVVFLTLELIQKFYKDNDSFIEGIKWITTVLYSLSKGLLPFSFFSTLFELICAQAPYNMRGQFAGYMIIIILSSLLLGEAISTYLTDICSSCILIILGVKLAVSLFGFIMYCLLARWYKRRERDDVYSAHRVVEEVYDRYLTAQARGT